MPAVDVIVGLALALYAQVWGFAPSPSRWISIMQKSTASMTQKEIDRCVWRRCVDSTPVQNWFAKFRSGNFNVEDAPRSGRPVEADKDAIKALVDANRRITTREIGSRLNLSNSTVYDHLKGWDYPRSSILSFEHDAGESTILLGPIPIYREKTLEVDRGFFSPSTNHTTGLVARRLFRVPPAAKALYIYKQPCLLLDSNPVSMAPQKTSLTTIPDG
ncbi:histone-lysine N-methyltransferase SETMAR [Trichonephila clavipes]|nr:histone-lysine N-methyltransferase SETMAR [Trichonephila clavipes]